jgi:rhodanese-related sulfurtransferase
MTPGRWRNACAVVVTAVMAFGCGYDGPTIDADQLRDRLKDPKNESLVVDVREKSEYRSGHVPGAVNLPLKYLGNEVEALAEAKGDVIVICNTGRRATAAAKLLQGIGVTVILVKDGMDVWKSREYPIEKKTRRRLRRISL